MDGANELFLKAVVADHRSFPDGSRIAFLLPLFFIRRHQGQIQRGLCEVGLERARNHGSVEQPFPPKKYC